MTSRGGASAAALGAEPSAESAAPEPSREERTPRPRWSGSKVRTRVAGRRAPNTYSPRATPESKAGHSERRHQVRLASRRGSGEPGRLPPPSPDLGRRPGPQRRRGLVERTPRWRLRPGSFDPPRRGGPGSAWRGFSPVGGPGVRLETHPLSPGRPGKMERGRGVPE